MKFRLWKERHVREINSNQQGLVIDSRVKTLNSSLQNWSDDGLMVNKEKSEKSGLWAKVFFKSLVTKKHILKFVVEYN